MDIVGTWRLKSAYFVAQGTGDRVDIMGANPFGFAIFDSSGRMVTIITSDPDTRTAVSEDVAALHKSMISYTGRWLIDGEKLVTHVDGAWDPSWVGVEQVRYLTLDGITASVRTAPLSHPSFPGDEVVGYVNWEREA